MAKSYPLTEFDTLTLHPATQMLKAMIPFLDYPIQRQFSLFIRVNELWQTINFLKNPDSLTAFSAQFNSTVHAPVHSLNDILNNDVLLDKLLVYCPENYASMINSFRQFSKMSELFNLFNDFGDSGTNEPDSLLNFENLGNLGNLANLTNLSNLLNLANSTQFNTASGQNDNSGKNNTEDSSTDSKKNNGNPSRQDTARNDTQKTMQNSANSAAFGQGLLNSFMKPEQQALYDEYIRQLNNLDFEDDKNSEAKKDTDEKVESIA